MKKTKPINYTREAFFHPGNLGALLAATLSVFFVGDLATVNLVLTMTFGAELIYLSVVPKTRHFQQAIRMRKSGEQGTGLQDSGLYYRLPESCRKRFLVLKNISGRVKQNFEALPDTSRGLIDSMSKKIDGLLQAYLVDLDLMNRLENYIQNASREKLQEQIDSVRDEVRQAGSRQLKEIKERRLSILEKRLSKLEAAEEKLQVSESQLQTIEDAMRYIYEKSMTMSSPEEIGSQLDNLIDDLEDTARMLDDLEEELPPTYSLLRNMEEQEVERREREAQGREPDKARSGSSGKVRS